MTVVDYQPVFAMARWRLRDCTPLAAAGRFVCIRMSPDFGGRMLLVAFASREAAQAALDEAGAGPWAADTVVQFLEPARALAAKPGIGPAKAPVSVHDPFLGMPPEAVSRLALCEWLGLEAALEGIGPRDLVEGLAGLPDAPEVAPGMEPERVLHAEGEPSRTLPGDYVAGRWFGLLEGLSEGGEEWPLPPDDDEALALVEEMSKEYRRRKATGQVRATAKQMRHGRQIAEELGLDFPFVERENDWKRDVSAFIAEHRPQWLAAVGRPEIPPRWLPARNGGWQLASWAEGRDDDPFADAPYEVRWPEGGPDPRGRDDDPFDEPGIPF